MAKTIPQQTEIMHRDLPSHRRESLVEQPRSQIREVKSAPAEEHDEEQPVSIRPSSSVNFPPEHRPRSQRRGFDSASSHTEHQRVSSCPDEISTSPPPLRDLRDLYRWDTKNLVDRGNAVLSSRKHGSRSQSRSGSQSRSKESPTHCEIIVEESEKVMVHKESHILAIVLRNQNQ